MNADELVKKINLIKKPFVPESEMGYVCDAWQRNIGNMRKHIATGDIQHFLSWSTVIATMFTGNTPYIEKEYKALERREDAPLWKHAIKESWIGMPQAFSLNGDTSGNLVHQAYHLHVWNSISKTNIKDLRYIIEFGGGYGALAYVAHRLGFSGTYIIFDIEEMLLLQEYYLSNATPSANVLYLSAENKDSYGVTDILDNALMIGLWSLSEAPIVTREAFLGMNGKPHSYLFSYSPTWYTIDNDAYFNNFADIKIGYQWAIHNAMSNGKYLVGTRR